MLAFKPLSATAQTAYAQLLDVAHALDLSRSVADLPGTFARKIVKKRTYWYYQYMDMGSVKRQVYVGPDNDRVRALVSNHEAGRAERGEALSGLARAAVALGNAPLLVRHFAVIQRLADHGLFRAGGVLIGTHAFLAAGNMLGVRWTQHERTQDIDFAHAGRSLRLALPADAAINVHGALQSLEMGLLPMVQTNATAGATYVNPADPEFQVDFLTPLVRGGKDAYPVPMLGTALQPVRFIEFVLEDIQQAVILAPRSGALVNIPHPARLAAHKILVAGDRPLSKSAKANKDAAQAAALVGVLADTAPESLSEAFADLVARGPSWVQALAAGRRRLASVAPECDLDAWLPTRFREAARSSARTPGAR